MKVAVAGGTGTLGAPLVAELARRGDEVLALSRTAGEAVPEGAAHRRVDLSSGEGLAGALAGVDTVVDASNTPPNAGEALVAGLPLRIPMRGRIGRPLREGALCNPYAAAGGPSFERWLAGG